MTETPVQNAPGRIAGGVLDPNMGRLSMADRVARGKSARTEVPRESHAVFDPPSDRPDPVAQLEQQAESRVPELVPIRYGRMLVSPFAYFRGAALPMASDLAATPCTGLVVQACGDAHLSNFGIFASPERKFLFDVNDFDETLPGPWEWDVKRLAASLEVAARGNGFSRKQRRRIVTASTRMYRQTMRTFASMSNIDVWYARVDLDLVEKMFSPRMAAKDRKVVAKNLAKARTKDSMQAFGKLAGVVDGQTRIIADPPLIMPVSHLRPEERDELGFEAQLDEMLARYGGTLNGAHRILFRRYQLVDLARKVVGVGSVGTRCWIFLFTARDGTEPLMLQVKEAQPSVLAAYAGPSKYDNQGQRVVEGQWLIQPVSDIFLGWQRSGPRRQDARLLRPPAARLEILHGRGPHAPVRHGDLRRAVRLDAGPVARPVRRLRRDRRLPRQLGRVRPGHHGVRQLVRGPERTRPPGTGQGRRDRPDHRPPRLVGTQDYRGEVRCANAPRPLDATPVSPFRCNTCFGI
jgi:uncharacterized protein (DUF2252 family)